MQFKLRLVQAICAALMLQTLTACAQTRPANVQHDFARWESEIAAYEQADRASPPPKGAVLFTGSSTIRMWQTLAQDFPQQKVINRGFGGSEIVDVTHFADRIIFPHEPRMIILSSGSNDINNGKSAQQIFEDFRQLVTTVHSKLPQTRVVFISLNPRISRWTQRDTNKAANVLIEQFVRNTPNTGYIETYDITLTPAGEARKELFLADNLHFNAEGYKLLAERVRAYLLK